MANDAWTNGFIVPISSGTHDASIRRYDRFCTSTQGGYHFWMAGPMGSKRTLPLPVGRPAALLISGEWEGRRSWKRANRAEIYQSIFESISRKVAFSQLDRCLIHWTVVFSLSCTVFHSTCPSISMEVLRHHALRRQLCLDHALRSVPGCDVWLGGDHSHWTFPCHGHLLILRCICILHIHRMRISMLNNLV